MSNENASVVAPLSAEPKRRGKKEMPIDMGMLVSLYESEQHNVNRAVIKYNAARNKDLFPEVQYQTAYIRLKKAGEVKSSRRERVLGSPNEAVKKAAQSMAKAAIAAASADAAPETQPVQLSPNAEDAFLDFRRSMGRVMTNMLRMAFAEGYRMGAKEHDVQIIVPEAAAIQQPDIGMTVTNDRIVIDEVIASNAEVITSNIENIASNIEVISSNNENIASNEEAIASNEETIASNEEAEASNEAAVVAMNSLIEPEADEDWEVSSEFSSLPKIDHAG